MSGVRDDGAARGPADLLVAPTSVITVGAPTLDEALAGQGVPTVAVDWRPPPAGSRQAVATVMAWQGLDEANRVAMERMTAVRPQLVDVRPAAAEIGLGRHQLLHAGPPIDWEAASGPLRGAIVGACLYEGWADSPDAAEDLAASGALELAPCHDHGTAGPMAGIVSPSMPMWIVTGTDGRTSRSTLNEGLGKVLRYGAFGAAITDRLAWMERVLGPALADALRRHGPVDVGALIGSMVAMGDEGHNRNRAGTSLLVRGLAPDLVRGIDEAGGRSAEDVAGVLAFVDANDHFLLNVVMAAGKLVADAGAGVPGSTVVVAMARNGTEFGIRTAGTGDRWFTAPAEVPDGLYLGGFGPGDANPDIGDSAITETVGLGGFAMAAAPAIVQLVGGQVDDAVAWTELMYQITLGEHPRWTVPALGFRGVPFGIDVMRVVRTGIAPIINTGMAGKVAGTGQVGAGLVRPPLACFTAALDALAAVGPVKPPPFIYHRPRTVDEAARLLVELGEGAKVIAGGQSLVPLMNFRLAGPEHLVDVNGVAGLDDVRVSAGAVEVGATVRTARLLDRPAVGEAHALLAEAAGWIAHAVIRNRGTVCGSLAHADPAAELPAVLALLGGSVEAVAWRSGALARRRVPAAELFEGPFQTTLGTDELLVGAGFPRLAAGTGWAMDELAQRHGDYALAGVVLTVTVGGDGAPTGGRAAYLSCAPTPVVVDLGPALAEAGPGAADAGRSAGGRVLYDLVAGALQPTGDIHASADYRRHLAATLTVRSLPVALDRASVAGAGGRPSDRGDVGGARPPLGEATP